MCVPLPALAMLLLPVASAGRNANPPAAYGPVPSARQLLWHEHEFYGFLHFTVNTFTDKEWGYGDESPDVFDPTDFDADQIVGVAKAAGMKGLILTAKHHDGFCLWPSKLTEHSVRNSSWRGGRGDVVREISDSCRKQGLAFGVYLSPWDRNHADYGHPSYPDYYRGQLRELLTRYGPIFEVWFDGANGGDGYYGGAREARTIDRRSYYDWPRTEALVRELQPAASMFSDAGPDVRWVGNEKGSAGDPSWATLNRADFTPGEADEARLNGGDRPGTHWLPAECDVSIRPGWFYHPSEDDKVRSAPDLLDLYYASVGRGASLLLNIPPRSTGAHRGARRAFPARVPESARRHFRSRSCSRRFGSREQRAWRLRQVRCREPPRPPAGHLLVHGRRRDAPRGRAEPSLYHHLQCREPARVPAPRTADRGVGSGRMARGRVARVRRRQVDRQPPTLAGRRRHDRPGAIADHEVAGLSGAGGARTPPRADGSATEALKDTPNEKALGGLASGIALAMTMFVEAVGYGMVAPTLPFMAARAGASERGIGLLVGLYAAVGLVAVIPLGALANRYSRRSLILFGLVCLTVASLGFVVAPTYGWLVAARLVQGLAASAIWVGALTIAADLSPTDSMGQSLSWITGAWSLGFVVGPALGGLGEVHTPFVAYAALSTAALLAVLTGLKEVPRPRPKTTFRGILGVLRLPEVLTSAAATFTLSFYYGLVEAFLPLLISQAGAGRLAIGLLFAIAGLPSIVLPRVVGRAADRIGDVRLIAFGLFFAAALMAVFLPLFRAAPTGLVFVLVGMVEVFVYVPAVALLNRGIDSDRRIFATASHNYAFSAGFFLGPVVGGLAMPVGGFALLFGVVTIVLLAGASLVLLASRSLSTRESRASGQS